MSAAVFQLQITSGMWSCLFSPWLLLPPSSAPPSSLPGVATKARFPAFLQAIFHAAAWIICYSPSHISLYSLKSFPCLPTLLRVEATVLPCPPWSSHAIRPLPSLADLLSYLKIGPKARAQTSLSGLRLEVKASPQHVPSRNNLCVSCTSLVLRSHHVLGMGPFPMGSLAVPFSRSAPATLVWLLFPKHTRLSLPQDIYTCCSLRLKCFSTK